MSGMGKPGPMQEDDPFRVIVAARAALKARRDDLARQVEGRAGKPYAIPSERTVADYEKQAARMLASGDPWAAALKTTKRSTWLKRKSALLFVAGRQVEQMLKEQDRLQRIADKDPEAMGKWADLRIRLHLWTHVLTTKPLANPLTKTARRQSKRAGLSRLPDDWREQLAKRLPTWRMQYLVVACAGIRPVEIGHGVKLRIEGDELVAKIEGAKLCRFSGQEVRELRWAIAEGMPELVCQLADEVKRAGGRLVVDYSKRPNKDPAKAFSGAMRNAARRTFPAHALTLTPYSLRHATASDLKASDLSDEQQSAALGHQVVETKGSYGNHSLSRGRSVAPNSVSATSRVRGVPTKPPVKPPAIAPKSPKADPGRGRRTRQDRLEKATQT